MLQSAISGSFGTSGCPQRQIFLVDVVLGGKMPDYVIASGPDE
jgi:hypothetical protein